MRKNSWPNHSHLPRVEECRGQSGSNTECGGGYLCPGEQWLYNWWLPVSLEGWMEARYGQNLEWGGLGQQANPRCREVCWSQLQSNSGIGRGPDKCRKEVTEGAIKMQTSLAEFGYRAEPTMQHYPLSWRQVKAPGWTSLWVPKLWPHFCKTSWPKSCQNPSWNWHRLLVGMRTYCLLAWVLSWVT